MSGTAQTYINFIHGILKQINILNGFILPDVFGCGEHHCIEFLLHFRVVGLIVSVAFFPSLLSRPIPFCLLCFLGRGVGLFLEYMVLLVQDSNFNIEVPPPIGGLQGFCAEVDRKLWDVSQGLEMKSPCQHIVSHLRFSGWVIVYISPVLVDLGTIFFKGSDR